MGKTITGSSTIGVTLSVNPTTIAGTIDATGHSAVYGSAAKSWTLANHGTLKSADYYGVHIRGGLNLNNGAGALISGRYAILVDKSASIQNAGTIAATGNYGAAIQLFGAGGNKITNSAKGIITGAFGITSDGESQILNQGIILGTRSDGVGVEFTGTLDNAKGGTIISGTGVEAYGASTIIDAGLIESSAGFENIAIALGYSAGSDVILQSGARIVGAIDGFVSGDTIDEVGLTITRESFSGESRLPYSDLPFGTLTLYDGNAVAGTLLVDGLLNTSAFTLTSDGAGGTDIMLGAATFTGSYGTALELAARTTTIAASGQFAGVFTRQLRPVTLINQGTITSVDNGMILFDTGTIENAARGLIEGGVGVELPSGVLIDAGTIIGTAGTAIFLYSRYSPGNVEVTLEAGAVLQGGIAGFAAGDTIDIAAVKATGASYGGGTLSLTNAGAVVEKIAIEGPFTSNAFKVGTAAGGGTDITMAPAETFSGHYGVELNLSALFTSIAAGASFGGNNNYGVIGSLKQAWTLVNSGTIDGKDLGVRLRRGQLTNAGSGTIAGGTGLDIGNATLVNAGKIIGTDAFGGSYGDGLYVYGTAGIARNLAGGSISGMYGGARAADGGTLSNAGTISGPLGVQLSSATFLNSGGVTGLGGALYETHNDTGLQITYGFASNAAAGIIAGPTGVDIVNGTLINAGHILGLPGGYREAPGGGPETVASAGILLTGGLAINSGTISGAYGAQLFGGTLTDSGTIASTIAAHGTAIAFGAAPATLALDKGNVIDGAISGFIAGDVIDFAGTTINSETFSKGVLTLKDGSKIVENLSFSGSLTTKDFTLVSKGTAGTELILNKSITANATMQFLRPAASGENASLTFPALIQPDTAPPAPAATPTHTIMGWLQSHPTTPPPLVPAVTLNSA